LDLPPARRFVFDITEPAAPGYVRKRKYFSSQIKFARKMFYVLCLQFTPPEDEGPMAFEAPLPFDITELISTFRNKTKQNLF
jgi:hypothetical protein